MKGAVVVDSNLAVLLIVGSASRRTIAVHKNLKTYSEYDFDLLTEIIAAFEDIVTVPHIMAETSNLVRQISGPAYAEVQAAFRTFAESVTELPFASLDGCRRVEFGELGLADAILLSLCAIDIAGNPPTLVTADSKLADRAISLGYSVVDYRREYMGVCP